MSHKEVEEYVLSMPGSWLDYPFGEGVAVYKIGTKEKGHMFALIQEGSDPVRISLKCDPLLAESLRAKYETVMPGFHLNKNHLNTVVLSGQHSDKEVKYINIHSLELVKC